MSALVIYILVTTAAALLLASALVEQRKQIRELRETLDGTRKDLVRRHEEAENYRLAAECASDGILIQDMSAKILWFNPAYSRIVGRPPEDIIGRNPMEFVMPDDAKPTAEEISGFRYDRADPIYRGLVQRLNKRGNGELFWNQHSVSFQLGSSGLERAVLVCRDVTAEVEDRNRLYETQSRLQFAASHDMLTGVANRSELIRFCKEALQDAGENGRTLGMLHLDIDKFKDINDTHGHSTGDGVLEEVADRIRTTIPTGAMVARLGGDEFVVVSKLSDNLPHLARLGEDLRRAIRVPLQIGGLMLKITTSIGAAVSDPSTTDPEDLMVQSDFALYEAKRRGRDQVAVYDEGLHRRHSADVRRAEQLREAIASDRFVRQYQPTFDMETGRVSGFETLVRWTLPDGSLVPPDEFLPLAETLGLMGELDLASMSAALDMKHRLTWAGWPDLCIAFNASSALLLHPDFVPRLIRGVEARRIDRSHIVIEVLETTMFGAPDSTGREAEVITDLRDAGFKVMLDDFGTGYAGLGHLTGLAVSGVKVDRALASQVLVDRASARVVETILKLCHDLGLDVVSEGVETCEIAEALHAMGCAVLQGYWVGRPMLPDDAIDWLGRHPVTIEPLRSAL